MPHANGIGEKVFQSILSVARALRRGSLANLRDPLIVYVVMFTFSKMPWRPLSHSLFSNAYLFENAMASVIVE